SARCSSCRQCLVVVCSCLFLPRPRRRCAALFPYTTLFRSITLGVHDGIAQVRKLEQTPAHALIDVERCRVVEHELGSVPASAPDDRKSTRLNSSHQIISYAVFCLKQQTSKRVRPSQPVKHA